MCVVYDGVVAGISVGATAELLLCGGYAAATPKTLSVGLVGRAAAPCLGGWGSCCVYVRTLYLFGAGASAGALSSSADVALISLSLCPRVHIIYSQSLIPKATLWLMVEASWGFRRRTV